jgi:hypothetical protein
LQHSLDAVAPIFNDNLPVHDDVGVHDDVSVHDDGDDDASLSGNI